jgi:hypothetical protein
VVQDCRFQNDTEREWINLSRLPQLSCVINVFERDNRQTPIEVDQLEADLSVITDGFHSRSADVPHGLAIMVLAKFASNPAVIWRSCGPTRCAQIFLTADGVIGVRDRCVRGLARRLPRYIAFGGSSPPALVIKIRSRNSTSQVSVAS